jgi:hypothetical protein
MVTARAADLLQDYEAKIAALERLVGRQALEIELKTGGYMFQEKLSYTQHHCAASRIPRRVDGPVHAYPRAQPPPL